MQCKIITTKYKPNFGACFGLEYKSAFSFQKTVDIQPDNTYYVYMINMLI